VLTLADIAQESRRALERGSLDDPDIGRDADDAFMLSGRAEAATHADWRLFVAEGANRDFTEEGEPIDLEDALYAAAQHGRSQTEAVARFAARIGVSIEKASRYADFIVAAVKYRATCKRAQTRACAFAPGAPFHDLVAGEAMEDPAGDLLILAHKNTEGSTPRAMRRSFGSPAVTPRPIEF
jgi:hypothetical protein